MNSSLCFYVVLDVCLVAVCNAQTTITVDWNNTVIVSKTTPTCQVVVNPLITRYSPIHDNVYRSIRDLHAEYLRYVPWFPYPKLGIAALDAPSGLSLCANVAEGFGASIDCGVGRTIDSIQYASFGTVTGYCNGFITGKCDAPISMDIVKKSCVGKQNCVVPADQSLFGNPCNGTTGVRLAIQATCNPPRNNTYWNFTYINPLMEDIMEATDGHKRIINFSTQPDWFYDQTPTSGYYPDDPLGEDFSYDQGNVLIDGTEEMFGEYYGRFLAYYTQGGFTDEYGVFHSSPYNYKIDVWEVLNEVEYEHSNGVEQYTRIYDSVVTNIRKMADPKHQMQFVGLALANPTNNANWVTYFLNSSNHAPGIPLDWISYHFYAGSATRTNPSDFEAFFPATDNFMNVVANIESIRMSLAPNVKTTIDEIGVILPDDNDGNAPPFPLIYWNAAASAYAYIFMLLSAKGIDALGSSQMMGYPQLQEIGRVLPPQYPSVSLLNWTTGIGTARYWTLSLIIDNFKPGDSLMATTISNTTSVYAQGFKDPKNNQKVLIINKKYSPAEVSLQNAAGGVALIVDLATGDNPARRELLKSDTFTLAPFAVVVVNIPVSSPVSTA